MNADMADTACPPRSGMAGASRRRRPRLLPNRLAGRSRQEATTAVPCDGGAASAARQWADLRQLPKQPGEEREMIEGLRARVGALNRELEMQGLVRMTSGNVSGRDPVTGLVAIKPSGGSYEKLTPEDLVVVDLEGKGVEGRLKPSVDTATHLYVYRARAEVNGVVHTHSNDATAFAAAGKGIPRALTAMADEFGGA